MSFQTILTLILLSITGCSVAGLVLALLVQRGNELKWRQRVRRTKTDIADMTILFQTMRDVIKQQKGLARDFNTELDKKMGLVRQVLTRGLEKNEKLYEQQHALRAELEASRGELESLQRQIAYLAEASERHEAGPIPRPTRPTPPRPPDAPPAVKDQAPALEETVVTPAAPLDPRPVRKASSAGQGFEEDSQLISAAFAEWDEPAASPTAYDAAPEEAPDLPLESPGDADSARQAFRALLDLEPAPAAHAERAWPPSAPPGHVPVSAKRQREAPEGRVGDNGSRTLAPLQKRVLEYSDAGMTVPEIARELGIGKGEVRLMLSLAKQKRR